MIVALIIIGVVSLALVAALVKVWQLYAGMRADQPRLIEAARRASVRQSKAVRLGSAFEQIVPMLPAFCESFSPADARFLGAPIDYVIFDGLDGGNLKRIVFVEVKSGARARLNGNQRMVQLAIEQHRVTFQTIHMTGGRLPPAASPELVQPEGP